MKKVLKIAVLIIVYLFLCGRSCQDDQDIVSRQMEEVEKLKNGIREEFGAGYLTEESKYAAEMTAIQKVKDMADYINIFMDTSLDTSFRQKAGEMIRDIFVSGDVRLSFGPYKNRKIKDLTVKKFLTSGFGEEVTSSEVYYDSVTTETPLKKSGPEQYMGTLIAFQKVTLFSLSDTLANWESTITISFEATQTTKIFGQDTLNTWAVNLGDMNIIE
jgi:hypothetical protein